MVLPSGERAAPPSSLKCIFCGMDTCEDTCSPPAERSVTCVSAADTNTWPSIDRCRSITGDELTRCSDIIPPLRRSNDLCGDIYIVNNRNIHTFVKMMNYLTKPSFVPVLRLNSSVNTTLLMPTRSVEDTENSWMVDCVEREKTRTLPSRPPVASVSYV